MITISLLACPLWKVMYNGKELDTERGLNWYDYGARMYDSALGRWHVATHWRRNITT